MREGDSLPKKGRILLKAGESLKAGGAGALKLKLWEGEIASPVQDNRYIGVLAINGTDFDDNVITMGADLFCEYEVLDSGNVEEMEGGYRIRDFQGRWHDYPPTSGKNRELFLSGA